MKRNYEIATSPQFDRYELTTLLENPLKKEKPASNNSLPSTFLKHNSWLLDKWVLLALQSVIDGSCVDKSCMETDPANQLNFLVFLDAQGKEYINEIRQMFPEHFEQLVFLSLNIDSSQFDIHRIHCSSTLRCKELAQYFNILDPLGGGMYPLNYLIVTDLDLIVRCKLPLRVGAHYGPHQRFGVSLSQLQTLIEEYLDFFARSNISITI